MPLRRYLPTIERGGAVFACALGVLAVMFWIFVVPDFSDASVPGGWGVPEQLQEIRSHIALYNARNPETAYGDDTPFETFWKPLLEARMIKAAPKNLLQDGTSSVHSAPRAGVGWVWCRGFGPAPGEYNLYGVDEHGNLHDADGDGRPD